MSKDGLFQVPVWLWCGLFAMLSTCQFHNKYSPVKNKSHGALCFQITLGDLFLISARSQSSHSAGWSVYVQRCCRRETRRACLYRKETENCDIMQPVATYRVTIQYNTKKAFYEAHMVSQNLRCRQSLGGER